MKEVTILLLTALLGAGCVVEPEQIGDPGCESEVCHTFHLYVSNQSLVTDVVAIDVAIDEVPVVAGEFALGEQRNWYHFDFELDHGNHQLRAEVPGQETELEQSFDLTDERWGVLEYRYHPEAAEGDAVELRQLQLSLFDNEPYFW